MNSKIHFATYLLAALLVITSFACQKGDQSSPTLSFISPLLDRAEQIQLGKEWDFVQNFYADQVAALKADPNNADARINLAELFIKEARITGEHGHYYPAALSVLENLLSSEPLTKDNEFRSLSMKAGVQLSLHHFADALETGKVALTLNRHNAQIYGVLADSYVEMGQYQKAIEMADHMVSIKPDIRSYSRVSYLREIHGDYEGAVEAMILAVKAGYPGTEETAWAMQTLGELYMLYGESEKAEQVFKAILEQREDYPFAVSALGALALQSGDMEKAFSITNEAMSIIPEVGFYMQMAEIYKTGNQNTEFESIIREIHTMLEDDVAHGHNMNLEYADLYLNLLEDSTSALEYASKEEVKRPENIDVNRLLSKIYLVRQDFQQAKLHFTKAKRTGSKHPDLDQINQILTDHTALSAL